MNETELYTAKIDALSQLVSALEKYKSAAEACELCVTEMGFEIETACRDAGIKVDVIEA